MAEEPNGHGIVLRAWPIRTESHCTMIQVLVQCDRSKQNLLLRDSSPHPPLPLALPRQYLVLEYIHAFPTPPLRNVHLEWRRSIAGYVTNRL